MTSVAAAPAFARIAAIQARFAPPPVATTATPTTDFASGRVTRAKTPTGVFGERPAASSPARIDGAAVMPM